MKACALNNLSCSYTKSDVITKVRLRRFNKFCKFLKGVCEGTSLPPYYIWNQWQMLKKDAY